MVNNVIFAGLGGAIAPIVTPPGSASVNPFNVNVFGDG